jgi:hypothetical protein
VLALCNGDPVDCYSKKLNNAKNYTITELEMLFTMDTHVEFRSMFFGTNILMFTDFKTSPLMIITRKGFFAGKTKLNTIPPVSIIMKTPVIFLRISFLGSIA